MVDKKMLKAFEAYSKGIYKILEADLTNDQYNIIKSDQKAEQLLYTKISEWMAHFAKTGQVHQDDIESYKYHTDLDYLRGYFLDHKNKAWRLKYRRLVGNEFRWVLLDMLPTEDYSDSNQIVYLFIQDVDEEMADPNADNVRLRKQLREQMAVSKIVNRVMTIATYEVDFDENGKIINVNFSDQVKAILGYKDRDLFPNDYKAFLDRVHPEDYPLIYEAERKCRNDYTNHKKLDVEYRILAKDGEYQWVRTLGDYERWIDGMPYRFFGVIIDTNHNHDDVSPSQER